MRYRNTKTGIVIDVSSEIHGDWEKIEEKESAKAPSSIPDKPLKKTAKKAK